jgi:hypothetical protein
LITQHIEPKQVEDSLLLRRIEIKKMQLQIALESNMPYVAQSLQNQLKELGVTDTTDVTDMVDESRLESDFQALMSLLDD